MGGHQHRPQKYYNPYYGDPQKSTPNFGKPPNKDHPLEPREQHLAKLQLPRGSWKAPSRFRALGQVGSGALYYKGLGFRV